MRQAGISPPCWRTEPVEAGARKEAGHEKRGVQSAGFSGKRNGPIMSKAEEKTALPERMPGEYGTPRLVSITAFLLLAAGYLVVDFCAYSLPAPAATAVAFLEAALILLLTLVNVRQGVYLLVILLIFSDDISRMNPYGGYEGLSNLLTVPLAGVSLGNYVVLGVIAAGCLFGLLRWLSAPEKGRLCGADYLALALLAIYLLAALHGIGALLGNPRGAINDLNLPIMVCGSYLLVRIHFQEPARIMRLWKYVILAAGAKAMVWAMWYIAGVGLEFGETIRVSSESGRVLLVLVFLFGFTLIGHGHGARLREKLLALGLSAAAWFNLLVNASRGPWLMAGFGLFVIFMVERVRAKIKYFLVAMVCCVALTAALFAVNPGAFKTIGYFAGTLRFWETEELMKSHSTAARVYEFYNIHAQLADHNNLLLGEGPGSRFSDRYHPFPFGLTRGDYTFEEIKHRRFENAHGLLQNLMLNTGYGGMFLILGALGLLWVSCYRSYRQLRLSGLRAISLGLFAFLPAMVYSTWSIKNNVLLGLMLGLAGVLSHAAREDREKTPPDGR
jgi:hypothetical protein